MNHRGGGSDTGMEAVPSPSGVTENSNGDNNYHGGRDRSPRKTSTAVAEVKVTQGGPFGMHGSGVEGAQSGVARAGVMNSTGGDAKRQRFSSAVRKLFSLGVWGIFVLVLSRWRFYENR